MPGKPKHPARLWLLTGVGESLFDLSPEDLFIFEQLAKHFYDTHAE